MNKTEIVSMVATLSEVGGRLEGVGTRDFSEEQNKIEKVIEKLKEEMEQRE